ENWTPESSFTFAEIAGIARVESWVEVTDVSTPIVSFRRTFRFVDDGDVLISESTLRFRERAEIETSLGAAGFTVRDVRDAPDRPGSEFVFIAGASDAG
ncbi:MAG: SAM-dependent methyltransferase, partial [Acidimicrobiales bacterium]